ncbi:MAG: QacE family quaternary ammonium compound efflux SMR transporter [Firmicutes bacterium]|nr:QacE family quaternary ammonium compound efflux SMR transporter [Bacillota bacterium]
MAFAYFLLAVSIGCEMVAASVTTSTKGFTVLKPTLICILGYGFSYYFFGLCLSDIDLSVGYATWGAVGTIVTPIVGYFVYKQKITKIGIFSLILIIISIITLNLFGW